MNSIAWVAVRTFTVPATGAPLATTCTAPGTVAAFSASLENRVIGAFTGTRAAFGPGRWPISVGPVPVTADVTVNVLVKGVSALPERSCTPLVATAVIAPPKGSAPLPSNTLRLSADIV